MNKDEARNLIAESIAEKGQFGYSVIVEIQGKYLVENNLVEAWATLRGQSKEVISAPDYSYYITLTQAKHLGLFDFVYDHTKAK